MAKYILTGFVKRLGRREDITKPQSLKEIKERKKSLEKDLKMSIPKYRWVDNLKIEKV